MSNLLRALRRRIDAVESETGISPRQILVSPDQFDELLHNLSYKAADELVSGGWLWGHEVLIIDGPVAAVGEAASWARGDNGLCSTRFINDYGSKTALIKFGNWVRGGRYA